MQKQLLLVVICLSFIHSLCIAAFTKGDVGTYTGQFLKLGAGARPAGMGSAFVAISDDATSVYWNPAGLARIGDKSLSIMHAVWFEDIFYDWFSYTYPTIDAGTFGFGLQYISYGSIINADETGLEGPIFKPYDLAVTVSYGLEISGISSGLSIKCISSKIRTSAMGFAGDIGAIRKLLEGRLSVGLAIQNIGTEMRFLGEAGKIPANIKLGGAYSVTEDWLLVVDVNMPADNEMNAGFGCEYTYKKTENLIFNARSGFQTIGKDVSGFQGLTLGLGVRYLRYNFDYAFVPYGDLGSTHRMSVGIIF